MGNWRIRELTALLGALTMMLAVMVWGASSATAGGPTSVLVTSPQSGQAHALYYSEKEYGQLEKLLGPAGSGSRDLPPEADLVHARQLNVTWLVHDISPWRFDRVFPMTRGNAVWIHTAANVPESMNGYWHRAERPARLRALLAKLGVMGKASPSDQGYAGIFPAPWQDETAAPDTAAPQTGPDAEGTQTVRVSVPSAEDGGTDWWWAIPGAAAGAVLALVLRRFVPRLPLDRLRRERDPGPRQELRDV
ncbi:hypothetical protein ACIHCX_11355 [Streptomyces sp. NPDC052043]|uniref:hypothetical protein n=1 Tax=Streptomyces sp. NPDC052043 TaxID=3365684 RepID=UPI0037D05C64